MVDVIAATFRAAKKKYDRGQPALADVLNLATQCLQTLEDNAGYRRFGMFAGMPPKEYWVAQANIGGAISRPFRPDLFVRPEDFSQAASLFAQDMRSSHLDPSRFDQVIYTAVTAFCLCYDIWKPKSRKTPGTFFEVLMGSAAAVYFSEAMLTKHIPITGLPVAEGADVLEEAPAVDEASDEDAVEAVQGNSVSTDLVLTNPLTGRSAVVPLKITTRERIVQPFAHQRILDSAYPQRFASFLACISEVQRDDITNSVKQVCVPGTVALFQKHLAALQGLYYCDIPDRYARPDVGAVIPVKPLHMLFRDIELHLRMPFSAFR